MKLRAEQELLKRAAEIEQGQGSEMKKLEQSEVI